MRMLKPVCALLALAACSRAERGADFGNDIESMWVKTPKGKFECIDTPATDHRQVLRLAGRVIYQQPLGPDGVMQDSTLRHGIEERGLGCPWVVAVRRGLVVIAGNSAPPAYGAQEYAVIDFNRAEPSLTRLATGQRTEDDDIPDGRRIEWSEGSLVLRVFGYAPDEECCTVGGTEPRPVRVRYTYENRRVEVVKD
jgi:hypothetical protein